MIHASGVGNEEAPIVVRVAVIQDVYHGMSTHGPSWKLLHHLGSEVKLCGPLLMTVITWDARIKLQVLMP
jgi:hypothetical protein